MPDVLVFDVNETLLDMQALAPWFESLLGDAKLQKEWFLQVLQYSLTSTIAGPYQDFTAISEAVLDMVAESHGRQLTSAAKQSFKNLVLHLPAHSDVVPALDRLREAGFSMATLTNSAPKTLNQQLANSGIADFFTHKLSVDAARKFKPAAEAYQLAVDAFGVETGTIRLVAAHAWDVAGAMRTGMKGAFVARSGRSFYPLAPKPDIMGPDLKVVAEAIIGKSA